MSRASSTRKLTLIGSFKYVKLSVISFLQSSKFKKLENYFNSSTNSKNYQRTKTTFNAANWKNDSFYFVHMTWFYSKEIKLFYLVYWRAIAIEDSSYSRKCIILCTRGLHCGLMEMTLEPKKLRLRIVVLSREPRSSYRRSPYGASLRGL